MNEISGKNPPDEFSDVCFSALTRINRTPAPIEQSPQNLNQEHNMPLNPTTVKNYERQIQLMTREAINKRSDGAEDHIPELRFIDLAQDLIENQKQTKVTTQQIRRSALIWKMIELKLDENQVRAVLELLDPLTKIKRKKGAVGLKNSRKPGRMIPYPDFVKLEEYLATMRGNLNEPKCWGIILLDFLRAGIASGARPNEWIGADWLNKRERILRLPTIKIKYENAWDRFPTFSLSQTEIENQKLNSLTKPALLTTESRKKLSIEMQIARITRQAAITDLEKENLRKEMQDSNQPLFRNVMIDPEYIDSVQNHLDNLAHFYKSKIPDYTPDYNDKEVLSKHFNEVFYKRTRDYLYRACKNIFPDGKIYSLYDTRSTFSSIRKKSQGLEKTSEEMGHASIFTTRDNYAPMRDAWHNINKRRKLTQANTESPKLDSEIDQNSVYSIQQN